MHWKNHVIVLYFINYMKDVNHNKRIMCDKFSKKVLTIECKLML